MGTGGCEWIVKITSPELGHGFDQVRSDEVCNPLRRFLTELGLKLNFQDTISEQFFVFWTELLERMVNPDIHPPPVVPRPTASIPIILADHGQFSIERDTNTSIPRELEGSSIVKGTHYYKNEGQRVFVKPRVREKSIPG